MGNAVSLAYPNGVTTTKVFDALNRVTEIETRGPAPSNTLIAEYVYQRNATGRITQVTETHSSRTVVYDYDQVYRLTSEAITDPTNGNRTITYTYDDVGNRLTKVDSVDGTTTYAYNNNDRLLSFTDPSGSTSLSYDNNGNV